MHLKSPSKVLITAKHSRTNSAKYTYTATHYNIVMNLFVTQTFHVMGPLAALVLLRTMSLLTAVKRSWNKRT